MFKVKLTNVRPKPAVNTTITIDVSTQDHRDRLTGGIIRTIGEHTGDHAGHMIMQLCTAPNEFEVVHAPSGSTGVSLRRYLFGPNVGGRKPDRKDLDYTDDCFWVKAKPTKKNELVYVLTPTGSTLPVEIGVWYVDKAEFVRHRGTALELRAILDANGLKFDNVFLKAIERVHGKPTSERVEGVDDNGHITPVQTVAKTKKVRQSRVAEAENTASVNMQVTGEKADTMMEAVRQVTLPKDTPALDMEVLIPIPFTGLNIAVRIKTN